MFKKVFLISVIFLPFAGSGQNIDAKHAYEALGAYTGHGYVAAAGYVHHISVRTLLRLDFFYSQEQRTTVETLHHQLYGADFYVGYTIKYVRSLEMYLSLLAGGTVSKEQGNFTDSPVDYQRIKYGGLGGFEAEKYFNEKWSLMACFNQRYLLDKDVQWGNLRWNAQLGVRFHLAKSRRE